MTIARIPSVLVLAAVLAVSGLGLTATACAADSGAGAADASEPAPARAETAPAGAETATFAGGCFWCMEPPFDKLEGVVSTVSGYAGGTEEDPTYQQVSSGRTGHTESLQVTYDPDRVSYRELLETYWHNVDPFDGTGQFCDRGAQYRPAIFPASDEQERLARESLARMDERFEQEIEVEIVRLDTFYPAEEYHQDFYEKNPARYTSYRTGCRRDARLEEIWGDDAGH